MENKIDIKKIVGNGNMAKLSHIIAGSYFYEVITEDGVYQFPVRGFASESGAFFKLNAKTQTSPEVGMNYIVFDKSVYTMTDDVGATTFVPEVKAMELMRWIRKAIENDELCKIG
jgi:hypothetical protein